MVINVKKGDCSLGGQVLGFRGIRSVGPRLGVAACPTEKNHAKALRLLEQVIEKFSC